MIKLQIVGNLGKDCIVNEVSGKNVINFSVAHTERFKDSQGNQKERTTWVECAYWTDKTGIVPYLKRGTMVYAEGAPEADPYMNKEGQAAATLRMRVQSVQLLGSKTEGQGGAPGNQGNYNNNQGSSYSGNQNNNYNNGNQGYGNASNGAKPLPKTSEPVEDDLPF